MPDSDVKTNQEVNVSQRYWNTTCHRSIEIRQPWFGTGHFFQLGYILDRYVDGVEDLTRMAL